MSAIGEGLTHEQLVDQQLTRIKQTVVDWNKIADAQFVLDKTNRGQQAFTWEAKYKDGTRFFQYPEIAFFRTLTDVDFVPAVDDIISTATLDKKQTVEYTVHPIAFVRRNLPWYIRPFTVVIKPEKDERLLAFWEVDYIPRTGAKFYRNALGIAHVDPAIVLPDGSEFEISRTVLVLSLSGAMTLANSTDVSFEGE